MPKRKAPESASAKAEKAEPASSSEDAAEEKPQVASGTPYPDLHRPSPEECMAACRALCELHGAPENPFRRKELDDKDVKAVQSALGEVTHSQRTVMDSLVRTILSQNTTDVNSHRTFAALKEAFPTWEEVRQASDEAIEKCIKSGGLAATKTKRIKAILDRLVEEQGEPSLEYLRHLPDDEIKAELSKFKGIGKKTIACVLMFCLGSHEMPVDTHVWRIAKKLGWVPQAASRDQTYEHLNERVPPSIKYDLHVLLVEHGKCCQRCAKNGRPRKPVLGPCPLGDTQQLAKRMAAEGQDLGIPERADAVLSQVPGSDAKQGASGKQQGAGKPAAEPKAEPENEPKAEPKEPKAQAGADEEAEPAAEGEDSKAGKGKGKARGKPAQRGGGRKRAKRS